MEIGTLFGKLTVPAIDGIPPVNRHRHVGVRCACGTEKTIRRNDLVTGRAVSCGCVGRRLFGKRQASFRRSLSSGYIGSLRGQ